MTPDVEVGGAEPTTARRAFPPRWGLPVLAVLPVLFLFLVKPQSDPPIRAGDSYHYLLHARALVEGRGYTNTEYVFTPLNPFHGPRVQPPGLPLFLAAVLAVFGSSETTIAVAMGLLTLTWLALIALYASRTSKWGVAVVTAWLVGLVPDVYEISLQALSDIPFAVVVWVLLLILARERWSVSALGVVVVVVGFLMSIRVVGVSALGALVVLALLDWSRNRALLIPVGVIGIAGVAGVGLTGVGLRELGPPVDLVYMLTIWPQNLLDYRHAVFAILGHPFPFDLANDLYHVAALAGAGVGVAVWVRDGRHRAALVFAVCYVSLLLFLPLTPDIRYTLPVAPLLVLALFDGVRAIAGRFAPPRVLPAVLPVTMAALTVVAFVRLARIPIRPSLRKHPDVAALVTHLGAHPPGALRVVFHRPRFLSWYLRQPGMPVPVVGSPDEALAEFRDKEITHIVTGHLDDGRPTEGILRSIVAARPAYFVREWEHGALSLYRFSPGALAP